MRARTGYTDAPADIAEAIEGSEVVKDFLPAPERLALREENVKVTLELSRRSVRLFKSYAHKRRLKYQRMIRSLVDLYAENRLADK